MNKALEILEIALKKEENFYKCLHSMVKKTESAMKINRINEAIAELKDFEKKQPDLDRLATLEATILDYYVAKGYVVGNGNWGFKVSINSIYKCKILKVYFYENDIENEKIVFSFHELNIKDMFDKAFEFFTCTGVMR